MREGKEATRADREVMERDARVHRIGGWVIFLALVSSLFLPEQYSLFVFAFPFGMVAVAAYYLRFRPIANLENGLMLLAAIIALQAATVLRGHFERSDIDRDVEQIACRSDLAERAGPELCEAIYGALHPEPPSESE